MAFVVLIAMFFYFQGSKHVYKKYLRPFFMKHQAKIDRFLNILSKELTKFVSSHEDEIRFIENVAIRGATTEYLDFKENQFMMLMFLTANYIVNGLDQPDESQASNAIEGPNPTATEEAGGLGTET
ncbi:hypothetical protein BAE44_0013440 [Dichanthelium oligosanthes]|uniref:Uncharacterized protein n=1 Tax=Dichanthelium oligosanthes TaxID=888268 RepID=A0A1E5VK92_9POAL|nr:hypothetical protein BAE44_0013440 [Dichanthelium oligosanthes]